MSSSLIKSKEAFANEKIDFALNCAEIEALFEAFSITPTKCEKEAFPCQTAKQAREFSIGSGVSRVVESVSNVNGKYMTFILINGLDCEVVKDLKRCAIAGECNKGTALERMSCQGGCIGGGLICCPVMTALRQNKNYGEKDASLPDKKSKNS